MPTRKIKLTGKNGDGLFAKVSYADYQNLRQYTWTVSHGYPSATIEGKQRYMHQVVLGSLKGFEVDHKDRDKLNNTRSNLRFACARLNQRNRDIKLQRSRGNLYRVRMRSPWGRIDLGTYEDKKQAEAAYEAGDRLIQAYCLYLLGRKP